MFLEGIIPSLISPLLHSLAPEDPGLVSNNMCSDFEGLCRCIQKPCIR